MNKWSASKAFTIKHCPFEGYMLSTDRRKVLFHLLFACRFPKGFSWALLRKQDAGLDG